MENARSFLGGGEIRICSTLQYQSLAILLLLFTVGCGETELYLTADNKTFYDWQEGYDREQLLVKTQPRDDFYFF